MKKFMAAVLAAGLVFTAFGAAAQSRFDYGSRNGGQSTRGGWATATIGVNPDGSIQLYTAKGRTEEQALDRGYARCSAELTDCRDNEAWQGCRWLFESGPDSGVRRTERQARNACSSNGCRIIQSCG